jgi:hypothetical protein
VFVNPKGAPDPLPLRWDPEEKRDEAVGGQRSAAGRAAGGLVRKEVFLRRVLKGSLNSEDHW